MKTAFDDHALASSARFTPLILQLRHFHCSYATCTAVTPLPQQLRHLLVVIAGAIDDRVRPSTARFILSIDSGSCSNLEGKRKRPI